jgi:guanylate kinase
MQTTMQGNLFILSAPSGAGKTSLTQALVAEMPTIHASISYTTRAPRAGEVDGRDYHFIPREVFLQMANRGDFLESAEIYGNLYGTSQPWVQQQIAAGRDMLLEIDWQGAAQVRRLLPGSVGIFILPPSLAALEARLRGRGKDSDEVIARRLQAACEEITHVAEFDYVIINDVLDAAVQHLKAIVTAAGLQRDRQLARHQGLLDQLKG